ncbi:hypothetical protein GW17_00054630, partial [Ensete ventricosum]
KMASHIVGYPRMGPKRELKFALESFWDGKSTADDLQKVATDLRHSIWKQMADAGIKYIPSNTFSYYDQMLDTTAMLGAVPERYNFTSGEIGFDIYFSMARGNASVSAMEMTKWFDTNYLLYIPFMQLGIETVPVLIGPVTYLLLSKPAKGVEKSFSPLSLLGSILPIYKYGSIICSEATCFPAGKYLFAGVVDGRNIWANDLASSINTLETLEAIVFTWSGCWFTYGSRMQAFFSANAAAQASRKSSPRVTNEEVQKAVSIIYFRLFMAADLKSSDHRRATNVSARLDAQQKKLNLPILPTTTIGSFPQTMDLRRVRREYKANK